MFSSMAARGATVSAGPGDAGLRAAVLSAQPGDTIQISSTVQLLSPIRIDKALTIRRAGSSSPAVSLKATFEGGMFQIASRGVTFENLTFEGSSQTDGLLVEQDVILRDCTLKHLRLPILDESQTDSPATVRLERVITTLNDGGLRCTRLQAKDSTFSYSGQEGASATHGYFEGCLFERNELSGLVVNFATVKNSIFRSNKGLGLFFDPDPGVLALSACLFQANEGGGLLLGEDGIATVDNCTLTKHDGPPAVLVREARSALFRHCTIANNKYTTPVLPGYPSGGSFAIAHTEGVVLQNCIVADNPLNGASHASGLVGPWSDGGGNVIAINPKLSALADHGGPTLTLLPQSGSPAIDAALPGNLYLDARGLARPAGTAPDAGAFETGATAPVDADHDGLPDNWELSHGLNPASAADAVSDKDGDGQTALAEFHSQTDPGDPLSVFRIREVYVRPWGVVPPDPDTVVIEWMCPPGVTFQVETSPDLKTWQKILGPLQTAGTENGRPILTMDVTVLTSPSYYRVVVAPNPFE